MPDAKILRTTVTPGDGYDLVQLEIADVSLPADDAATHLTLAVRIPAYSGPQLAYLQYQAIDVALDALKKNCERGFNLHNSAGSAAFRKNAS